MNEERFNVVVFDLDGYWHYVNEDIPAKQAVEAAKRLVTRAATLFIEIDRVMITDADDNTNFLWQRGKGVVFPPRQETHQETATNSTKPTASKSSRT